MKKSDNTKDILNSFKIDGNLNIEDFFAIKSKNSSKKEQLEELKNQIKRYEFYKIYEGQINTSNHNLSEIMMHLEINDMLQQEEKNKNL